MIRPVTLLTALLAFGSGLYLYQEKHNAQLLDRDIRKLREATEAARARAGILRADYMLLNDPSRLSELAERFIPALRTTPPGQFTTMAELARRLPGLAEPHGAPAVPPEPDNTPVAQAPGENSGPASDTDIAAAPVGADAPAPAVALLEDLPIPPLPPMAPPPSATIAAAALTAPAPTVTPVYASGGSVPPARAIAAPLVAISPQPAATQPAAPQPAGTQPVTSASAPAPSAAPPPKRVTPGPAARPAATVLASAPAAPAISAPRASAAPSHGAGPTPLMLPGVGTAPVSQSAPRAIPVAAQVAYVPPRPAVTIGAVSPVGPVTAPVPMVGSALGMARTMTPGGGPVFPTGSVR